MNKIDHAPHAQSLGKHAITRGKYISCSSASPYTYASPYQSNNLEVQYEKLLQIVKVAAINSLHILNNTGKL